MNIENLFTGNFNFSVYEYELKARVMALNALLLVLVAILPIMTVVRYNQGNLLQGTANLTISVLSIFALFWIKGHKNRINTVARFVCLSGWGLISTLMITVPEDTLRIGWYLILLAPTFFLCGTRFGILISTLSVLAVSSVHILGNSGYSNYDILYFSNLCAITTLFLSFYEYKVTSNRLELQKLSRKLESTVRERTAELTKSNKELAVFFQALDSLPDSVIVTSLNGIVSYANKAASNFSGHAENEIIGESADMFFSDKSLLTEYILPQQKEHGWWMDEFQAKRKSGAVFPAFATITDILDESDTSLGILFIFKDLTEIKRAEQEKIHLENKLLQAGKMEAIGLMAGGVAHNLNNTLSGLTSLPDLLLMKLEPDSSMRRPLELIRESGQKASAMVDDLLTIATGAAKTSERLDLNALVYAHLQSSEYNKLVQRYPENTIRVRLDPDLKIIVCSRIHVEKSLKSLLLNAFEAMPEGGTCRISTENKLLKEGNSEELLAGEYVLLTIEDEGEGVNEENMEHIFEPFYTKKKMGRTSTGLGLAVVWNTMQEHDGAVTVRNTNRGTAFSLHFPAADRKTIIPASHHDAVQDGAGKKILVIDDEELLREIATGMLKSQGYEVHAVESGEKAIEYLKGHQAELILLDMVMEPGISGLRTYEKIVKMHPGQKAIVVSGFAEHEEVKKTLQLGACGFLKKPYTMLSLSSALQKILS